jgi:phosphoribosylanthranilate isomerase
LDVINLIPTSYRSNKMSKPRQMSESRKEKIRVEQEKLDAKNKEIAEDLPLLQAVQAEFAEAEAQLKQAQDRYDALMKKVWKVHNPIKEKQRIARSHESEIYYLNHPRARPKPTPAYLYDKYGMLCDGN